MACVPFRVREIPDGYSEQIRGGPRITWSAVRQTRWLSPEGGADFELQEVTEGYDSAQDENNFLGPDEPMIEAPGDFDEYDDHKGSDALLEDEDHFYPIEIRPHGLLCDWRQRTCTARLVS